MIWRASAPYVHTVYTVYILYIYTVLYTVLYIDMSDALFTNLR